ncbi:MAG: hypothetical protein MJ137_06280, partial [Clostridia bacterium]|nr:hypothetical protein [Clostridia bacterium]
MIQKNASLKCKQIVNIVLLFTFILILYGFCDIIPLFAPRGETAPHNKYTHIGFRPSVPGNRSGPGSVSYVVEKPKNKRRTFKMSVVTIKQLLEA